MRIIKYTKFIALAGLVLAFATGCATAPEEDTQQASASSSKSAGGKMVAGAYNVGRGDSLWDISGKRDVYGNAYQWPLLYKSNSDKIADADLIYPGQNLAVNRSASGSEVSAAVRHAKTRGSWSLGSKESSDMAFLGR